ncbi:MAG: FAD-dependent oxidoreductase [Actinomycetota bacterium]
MNTRQIVAPCQAACPALTDVQEYVSLAALGRFAEAFEVARLTNPIAASCGYICFHPCEEKCRRTAVDEAVSIMELKRAAAVYGTAETKNQKPKTKNPIKLNGKEIAVVGAGPAGLTAAQDLALAGASVTVYERENKAGGMLRQTIPAYRLPDEAIDRDVEAITSAGVTIEYGRELGANLALDEMVDDFDAVVVATGLPLSQTASMFPVEGENIYAAIPFLKAVKAGTQKSLKNRVIVVGGGNVAIDSARSAARLGAHDVTILYRRGQKEMPARQDEIADALTEGVKLVTLAAPVAIERLSGCLAVTCVRMELGKVDASGRRRPVPVKGSEYGIKADTVIVAIGQARDTAALGEAADRVTKKSIDGVFMTGEFAEGPGSAIQAVQSGHDAAGQVISYLTGSKAAGTSMTGLDELPDRMRSLIAKKNRKRGAARPADDRRKDFGLFEPGLTQIDTVREALRCLSCLSGAVVDRDTCIACLTCVRVCPFEIPKIGAENVAEIDPVECPACGLCVTECPASAIALTRGQAERLVRDIDGALAGKKDIEFFCMNRLENTDEPVAAAGRVPVPCAAQVSETAILTALLKGAKSVSVSICPESGCRYGSTEPGRDARRRLTERIMSVKETLAGLGLDPESINIREN